MATILEQEDEQQQGQQTTGAGPQEQTTGGGAAAPGMGASTPQAYQPQQKGSGRFTNIKKYIGANKPAGEQLSSRIGKEGQESASRVREGIESSKSRFGEQEGQLRQGIEAGREAAQSAYQAPTNISEEQRGQFGELYGGGLQQQIGDVDMQSYTQPVQSQAQGLQDMAEAAKTEQGRFGLLRNTFSRPGERYTTGQQRLDELFLQGTPSAGQLGQQLGDIAGQVGQEASAFGEDIGARQQALAEMAGTEREAAENLLLRGEQEGYEGEQYGGGLEDIQAGLGSRLEQLRADAPGQYAEIQEALASNVATPEMNPTLQNLQDIVGNSSIYNLDLNKYLTGEEAVEGRLAGATPEQLATQEEYQRFQNIAGLLGQEGLGITEEQAGTFNPFEIKGEELRADLEAAQGREQEYRDTYAAQQAGLDRLIGNDLFGTGINYSPIQQHQQLKSAYMEYSANPSAENLQALNEIAGTAANYGGGDDIWEQAVGLYANPRNQARAIAMGLDPSQISSVQQSLRELQTMSPERRLFQQDLSAPDKLLGYGDEEEDIIDPLTGKN